MYPMFSWGFYILVNMALLLGATPLLDKYDILQQQPVPTWYHSAPTDSLRCYSVQSGFSPFTTVSSGQWSAGNIEFTGNPEFLRESNSFTTAVHCSALSAPPSPFSHKSLHRLSEDQSSCSSQINKMNFKFLLAGIWRASFSSNHN